MESFLQELTMLMQDTPISHDSYPAGAFEHGDQVWTFDVVYLHEGRAVDCVLSIRHPDQQTARLMCVGAFHVATVFLAITESTPMKKADKPLVDVASSGDHWTIKQARDFYALNMLQRLSITSTDDGGGAWQVQLQLVGQDHPRPLGGVRGELRTWTSLDRAVASLKEDFPKAAITAFIQ